MPINASRVYESKRFLREYDRVIKYAGKQLGKRLDDDYKALVAIIESGEPIPEQYKEHPLKGRHAGEWEVHLLGRTSDYLIKFKKYVESGELIYEMLSFTKHDKLLHARLEANLRACLELADYLDDEDLDYILKLCDKYGVEVE